MENISLDLLSLIIVDSDIILRQDHSLVVLDQIYFSYVLQESRDIRCDEVESFAYSCYERCIFSYCNDLIRLCRSDRTDRICASHLCNSLVHSFMKITFVEHAYQVRDHFRIGLRFEVDSFFISEPFLEFLIILDYTVMHYRDAVVLIAVRMRIEIRRHSVRRPSSMTYTH